MARLVRYLLITDLRTIEGRATLTVEELWRADLLPLGRTALYEGCHAYLASNGTEGIPCRRVGYKIFIPVALLLAWLGADAPLDTGAFEKGGRRG